MTLITSVVHFRDFLCIDREVFELFIVLMKIYIRELTTQFHSSIYTTGHALLANYATFTHALVATCIRI
jgi:hypothetical protein